jgi:hypothetical protein
MFKNVVVERVRYLVKLQIKLMTLVPASSSLKSLACCVLYEQPTIFFLHGEKAPSSKELVVGGKFLVPHVAIIAKLMKS